MSPTAEVLSDASRARLPSAYLAWLTGCRREVAQRISRLPPALFDAIVEASTPGRSAAQVQAVLQQRFPGVSYDMIYSVRRALGLRSARGRKSGATNG